MVDFPLRWSLLIGLLATVPLIFFAVERSEPVVGLAIISVLVVLGSLFLSFAPPESEPTPGA